MSAIDAVSWLEGKPMDDAALIVLNQPIVRRDIFDLAWDACSHVAVTDGAANHLASMHMERYVPDFIIGDFDSIKSGSRTYYEKLNVPFVSEPDQYSTDFMKAMKHSHILYDKPGKPIKKFLAFGAQGGRVDHTWHAYLCMSLAKDRGDRLILLGDQSLTLLLEPGEHTILTPRNKVGKTCGYAPLEGDATVTTKGFEWDVEDYTISFTTRLSTSNHLMADEVSVKTDKPVMFTMELK